MIWYLDIGLEEGGDGEVGAKKCPVDIFLARGRVRSFEDAAGWLWTQSHNRKMAPRMASSLEKA